MNRPLVLTLSPVLLLPLVGCASTSERNATQDAPASPGVVTPEHSAVLVATPNDNAEFVLGESYNHEAVPSFERDPRDLSLEEIRGELEAMYDHDRELVRASYAPGYDAEAQRTVQAIDRAHSERLKEIVTRIGWPTRDQVGLKATQGAYMVIQHAGHDVEFQNECLSRMVDLVAEGQLPASYVALLTDRIRVFSGQEQVFGTQMSMARNELGQMVPTPTVPIEAPQHLNERRALMGMVAHEQFVEAIHLAYEASLVEPGTAFATVETDSE